VASEFTLSIILCGKYRMAVIMKKKGTGVISGVFAVLLLTAAILFFILQGKNAVEVVNFHAEMFEKKGTVIVDAGHGGEDGGAVGINGVNEKDINLAIALELQRLLEQNQFEVIMIRDADYSVGDNSLGSVAERKRSDTLNRAETILSGGECIVLSIHQNHFSQSKYYGAQVFYSPNRDESTILAECIRSSIVSKTQPENTRELKEAGSNIYLMSHANVPSVLVECGFLSNPEETEKLCDPQYQQEMAAAIYDGLIQYLQEMEKVQPGNGESSESEESLP